MAVQNLVACNSWSATSPGKVANPNGAAETPQLEAEVDWLVRTRTLVPRRLKLVLYEGLTLVLSKFRLGLLLLRQRHFKDLA